MKIKLKHYKIKDIVKDYVDHVEEGCFAYGGRLNIRPKYQREFVYKDEQRNEVIRTINKNFPLNVMYWIKNKTGYEVLDGQQRTISFCQYINGDFSVDNMFFNNLCKEAQDKILNYELSVYICDDVIIGAGSLVPPGKTLKSGYLYVGRPAKQIRALTEEEMAFFSYTAGNYVNWKNQHMQEDWANR